LNHLVIGVGNSYRRDDGVGLVVAEKIAALGIAELDVRTAIGEPGAILDAWAGADLAVVVDAAKADDSAPGRIRRLTAESVAASPGTGSHSFGLAATVALGHALDRMPKQLVVFTVDVADVGLGPRLSNLVAAAVPVAVDAVLAEFGLDHRGDLRPVIED